MKTFKNFIPEAQYHNLLIEGPKPPDYNYEEAFVRLYNYLTGSEDKKDRVGKQMRALITRTRPGEDSAEQAGIMNDIVSLIAKEVNKAEKDPNHPLHFNNIPNVGFTRGGKTPAHQTAYYEKLNGQKYTFLNLIRSKSGRSMGAQGLLAIRAGSEKTPLSPRGEKVYGKSSDTSKADVLFKDSSGEVVHTSSLKDVGGSVFASSGPEETKGNLLMGMYASLDSRLENNEIDQNEYNELVEKGTQLASEIALKMTTKGLSKEEEKKIINPEIDSRGLFKTMGDFEDSFPGVSEYVAKEQITGKGKYGQGVSSVLKTNKGGELIEFPEFLSTFVNQRFRTSKHGEKGNVSVAADAQKVDPDIERPGPDREAYSKLTKSNLEKNLEARIAKLEPEIQAEIRSSLERGDLGVDELDAAFETDSKLKNFKQFNKEAEAQHAQTAQELEQQKVQAEIELKAAIKAHGEDDEPRYSDGKVIPRQYRGTWGQNNPQLKQEFDQQRAEKTSALQAAQNAHASAVDAHQTHISTPPMATLDTIRQGAAKARASQQQPAAQQPVQQEPVQQQQPAPQQPVQQEPVQQQPVAQQPVQQQQPAAQQPVQQEPVQQQQPSPENDQKKKKKVQEPEKVESN